MREHIMQFFAYEHLPEHLQAVSKPFAELARAIVGDERGMPEGTSTQFPLPRSPEREVALRKLLEAKDAAVRARLSVDVLALPSPDCGISVKLAAIVAVLDQAETPDEELPKGRIAPALRLAREALALVGQVGREEHGEPLGVIVCAFLRDYAGLQERRGNPAISANIQRCLAVMPERWRDRADHDPLPSPDDARPFEPARFR